MTISHIHWCVSRTASKDLRPFQKLAACDLDQMIKLSYAFTALFIEYFLQNYDISPRWTAEGEAIVFLFAKCSFDVSLCERS